MKKSITVFLMLMLILSLGACGGKTTEAGTDKENQAANTDSQTVNESFAQTTYSYLHDCWDLYIATLLSEKTLKIEKWGRFSAGADGDPFKYDYDVSIISTDDSSIDFQWLDDGHTAFSLTMKDDKNSHWDEPCSAGFVVNKVVTESSTTSDNPVYAYRNDQWDVYVAVKLSDNIIKIENWDRFSAGVDGDPFVYDHDVCVIDTKSENYDFTWLDDSLSAFSVTMKDEENSHWEDSKTAFFALSKNFIESNANDAETIYTYQNDQWDLYVGIALSETTIKIENWDRFNAGPEGDPFMYEYDVAIITTEGDDNPFGFSWIDDSHTAFTVTLEDKENSHWDGESTVSFAICPSFDESYIQPLRDYEDEKAKEKAAEESEDTVDTEDSDVKKNESNSDKDARDTEDAENAVAEEKESTDMDGELFTEDEITYELRNGKLTAIKYDGNSDSVSIPSEIEGHPVVAIGESVFEDCTELETVILWADIESVGNSAFKGCTSLSEISLPSETTIIGAHAFEGCTSLETAILWGDPSIEEYAFYGCTALESMSIGSDTDHIGAHAFEGCTALDDLILWGVSTIDEYAFAGCTSISSLSIPTEVQKIGAHAFDGCSSLESVIIWGDDTDIGEDAFANCPKLSKVP